MKNKEQLFLDSNDSLPKKRTRIKLSGTTKYTDYKIISFKKDTTYIDTTLTILKEYNYNFLRKDNFELLAFHNQGQTFNQLGYQFNNPTWLPNIGMQAKHFYYLETKDINYYEVPTPTTEILYRTGIEQGQVLETLFTLNFSKRFNAGIAYKGLRSLGNYRNSLTSHGNFRTVFSYNTKNKRYFLKGHLSSQDLFNTESGGLTSASLANFIADDSNFTDRGRLDVNLEGTDTKLEGKRFYFEHNYKLFSSKDSIQKQFTNLKIGHVFTNELKLYEFNQTTINTDFFGSTSASADVSEKVENRFIHNQLFLEFNSRYVLGTFRVQSNITNYSYGYNAVLNTNTTVITDPKLKGSAVSFGADWKATIKNFQLTTEAHISPGTGRLSGSTFYSQAKYQKDSLFTAKGSISLNSKSPNFNTILFQSAYDKYNWQNNNFKNTNTRNIHVGMDTKWLQASADITNIENYTYFDMDSKPQQAAENITYLKIKASNEFTVGKFALNNTFLFQKASTGSAVFKVPSFVTRNTLYYSSFLFKGNPLFLQTGITFKYFSKYNANALDPLLNEFRLQNTTEIGYPTVDFFINAQIRRTRIYFKIENVTSDYTEKNYFSAPNYPYRDFTIRFGLVWNWFI
ncbi:MAG: putative porin [Polaribacter sp.]|nr:putative porin [Polaribacter sp.]